MVLQFDVAIGATVGCIVFGGELVGRDRSHVDARLLVTNPLISSDSSCRLIHQFILLDNRQSMLTEEEPVGNRNGSVARVNVISPLSMSIEVYSYSRRG